MSASTEEYLEALYTLTQNGRSATTSDLSRRLKIAPASVTEMLKKLKAAGYIEYSPYRGATLTLTGFKLAQKMARKHRLLERFLHDVLKLGKEKVHKEACAMEHTLSDETERALCKTLNAPDRCPDDEQDIPACDLDFSSCEECIRWKGDNLEDVGKRNSSVTALSSLKEKQEGIIAFIRGDKKVLQRLMDMGLTPGTKVCVNRIAPLNGPVEILGRGCKLALGDRIVSNVFVENPLNGGKG